MALHKFNYYYEFICNMQFKQSPTVPLSLLPLAYYFQFLPNQSIFIQISLQAAQVPEKSLVEKPVRQLV